MTQLLKGRPVKDRLLDELKTECAALKVKPCLGVFRIGENADDLSYERGIVKTMNRIGVSVEKAAFSSAVSFEEAAAAFRCLCEREDVDGVLPLMPLPEKFLGLIPLIPKEKDVDGLLGEESDFVPCTPHGVMRLLEYYGIAVKGRNVTVIGRICGLVHAGCGGSDEMTVVTRSLEAGQVRIGTKVGMIDRGSPFWGKAVTVRISDNEVQVAPWPAL